MLLNIVPASVAPAQKSKYSWKLVLFMSSMCVCASEIVIAALSTGYLLTP